MIRSLLAMSILVSLLVSCSNAVYEDYKSVGDNYIWSKSESQTFEFSIDNEGLYDVELLVRYVTGYPYDKLRITVQHDLIESKVYAQDLDVVIQETKGAYQGEPSLDLWDLNQLLFGAIELQKKNYQIKVVHDMPIDNLPFVSEIGLRVTPITVSYTHLTLPTTSRV